MAPLSIILIASPTSSFTSFTASVFVVMSPWTSCPAWSESLWNRAKRLGSALSSNI